VLQASGFRPCFLRFLVARQVLTTHGSPHPELLRAVHSQIYAVTSAANKLYRPVCVAMTPWTAARRDGYRPNPFCERRFPATGAPHRGPAQPMPAPECLPLEASQTCSVGPPSLRRTRHRKYRRRIAVLVRWLSGLSSRNLVGMLPATPKERSQGRADKLVSPRPRCPRVVANIVSHGAFTLRLTLHRSSVSSRCVRCDVRGESVNTRSFRNRFINT
jgi:hypothetical protein